MSCRGFGVLLLAAAGLWLVGCGLPPELTAPPAASPRPGSTVAPAPVTSRPAPSAPVTTGPAPTSAAPSPGQPDTPVVPCLGSPTANDVINLLRQEKLLTRDTAATVTRGPLCADGWQFTVINVAGRDPLQVITTGTPKALTLVTAGTQVCAPEVEATAPPGIQAVAGCVE